MEEISLKKLSNGLMATVLFITMLFMTPVTMSAHHGGSNWVTDYSYLECRGNDQYKIHVQHRHIRGKTEYRFHPELTIPGFCMIVNSQEE